MDVPPEDETRDSNEVSSVAQANVVPDLPANRPSQTGLHGSACDTCRRRRVRCNGGQPCDRCTKSAITCTYGRSVGRMSSVGYTRHLERRIEELENLLRERTALTSNEQQRTSVEGTAANQHMVDVDVTGSGNFVSHDSFYGRLSGLGVLQTFGDLVAQPLATLDRRTPRRDLLQAFERTHPSTLPYALSRPGIALPAETKTRELIDRALNYALIGHNCIDVETLNAHLDRLYDVDPEDYRSDDWKFAALVYALLALGKRFEPMDASRETEDADGRRDVKGLSYFRTSCDVLDHIGSHDLCSVRTTICHTKFLLTTSMISQAYMHHCRGVTVALRMGLHVCDAGLQGSFTSDELLQRRQVIATLNMMDAYFASMLGMPKSLKPDPRQTLGVSDEEMFDGGRSVILAAPTSQRAEALCYQQLSGLVDKILTQAYLDPRPSRPSAEDVLFANDDAIADISSEIDRWQNDVLSSPQEGLDPRALMAQLSIRLMHSATKCTLHRPFLHHLVRHRSDRAFDIRGYEFGSKCVEGAMQAVLTVQTLHSNGLLHEAHWTAIYMLAFSVSILSFFVKHSAQSPTVRESLQAAIKAKDLLHFLGRYSRTARQCHASASAMIETLSAAQ